MGGSEGFNRQVSYSFMEIVVMCRDKSALFSFKGMFVD